MKNIQLASAGKIGLFRRIYICRKAYIFVLPFIILFFLFTVLPVLMSIGLSFTSFNSFQAPKFVFMENYINLFLNDSVFIKALKNTFMIAIITGPLGYFGSLMFAWLINELTPRLRALMTLVFYAPNIVGGMGIIWMTLFSGDSYGYLNGLLMKLGAISSPIVWLKDTRYMFLVLVIVVLWSSLGAGFLSFIAGFQGIDRSLHEAGAIDGIRNRWQELWFITLPVMRPQMMFGAIMSITSSLGVGAIVTQMFGSPSTDYHLHTIVNHLDDYGGIRFEMGYASAIATILFILMVGCNKLVQKLLTKVGT